MKRSIISILPAALLVLSFNLNAGVVDPALDKQIKKLNAIEMVPVIISLNTRANTNSIADKNKISRRTKIIRALRTHADAKQPAILTFIRANGATDVKPLWINNSIAAKVPARLIRAIARRPAVAKVSFDATLSATTSGGQSLATPEWNLSAIHAPELWQLGQTGQNVVVANMDTGVDVAHPDLTSRWRGGTNSWYDPHGQYASPTDYAGAVSGHGTQTMGLIAGGDTGGTTIGVAPGAKWIAAKIFNSQGNAQESHFHQSFQWLLDPDNNPATGDAPDVVNGSFQTATANVCDTRFLADIQALKTAGIAVVFSAGNSGPGSMTSSSPANNPGSFAAGAVDYYAAIASFSARGPAPASCGGGLFPHLVAPGVDVVTSDLSFAGQAAYAIVSGTSFAAPHVAGGMALLLGAFPNTEITALESALTATATDLGAPGADNESGYGMLNVLAAYNVLNSSGQNPVGVDDSYVLDEDNTLATPTPGMLGNDSDPQNQAITAILVDSVAHGTLALNADGSFSYTPTANYSGEDSFSYKVSDGLLESGVVTVLLTINPVNDAPVAQADSAEVANGGTTTISVLTNDSDPDNTTLTPAIVRQPANGSAVVNQTGAVVYTHNGSQTTSDSFTYNVTDGELSSNTVTVAITVNPAQLSANPDSYTVAEDNALAVPSYGVLANDNPGQGLTAQLDSPPAHAASFALNPNGSFNYTPGANFNGSDSFTYKANDGSHLSESAVVSITVSPVNDAPVAANDSGYSVISGQSLTVPTATGVLVNDSDIENDALSALLASSPVAGQLSLNASGSFTYNSSGVAAGLYTFSYTANDGMATNGQSNIATVTINVLPNTSPVANADTYLYRANVTRTVNLVGSLGLGVLSNDTDAENNPLSALYVAGSLSGGGTLNLNATGSFTYLRATAANASFRYRASDGLLSSLPATGTTVQLRADAAPVTVADNCSYDVSDNATTGSASCTVVSSRTVKIAVAFNDTDPNTTTNAPTDGVGKSIVLSTTNISSPGTGVKVLANPACGQSAIGAATGTRATLTNNCDGTVTAAIASGNSSNSVGFSYKVSDDLGMASSVRAVTLSVQP